MTNYRAGRGGLRVGGRVPGRRSSPDSQVDGYPASAPPMIVDAVGRRLGNPDTPIHTRLA
jgi:hypothetical protein